MNKNDSIFIAGHKGLVGSAIVRCLQQHGFTNLLTQTRSQLDLTDQTAVYNFFNSHRPQYIFQAAGRVGGIHANDTYPAEFIRENLLIQTNIVDAAWRSKAKKLLFLGSSCIYPKFAPQPLEESCLLTGPLEPSNEWYAIAKISGIKMCQAYRKQYGFNAINVMPTNLYGPEDNFHSENAHILPALLRRFHEAKMNNDSKVAVWGTGSPKREFLHVDDLADACLFLMEKYDQGEVINVGVGKDITISELATLVKEVVGYQGELHYDHSKPDGTPRKLLDVSKIEALGWHAKTTLKDGVKEVYRWFLEHLEEIKK
ncbi:MAG: NAD-dependent epimerase/dehydratase family protein [Magnetococcales bacterium]|nr:NAD-dependent epimerase/dehydratase family protein [Magnetococcales bacterium]